jgi:hypothetical protein
MDNDPQSLMPIEAQVRDAIDHFTARVRHDVDSHVDALTMELLRLVEERENHWRSELDRVTDEARAEVDETFSARIETLREDTARIGPAWRRRAARRQTLRTRRPQRPP